MKFDDLDKTLRIYETAHDFCVPPNFYIVARIDGRSFTKLTKETLKFEAPYDVRFRDYMIETVKHLMTCGFNIKYGYTQSDEISLLFDLNEDTFSRKTRKFNSVLAGEASAKFSLLANEIGTFDCRISQLPRKDTVTDYFRWRQEDAHRNALNSHCYWLLRKMGKSKRQATKQLEGKSKMFKNELLFQNGINFNDLPLWQKRGVGFYWNDFEKKGFNPIKKQEVTTVRKEIKVDLDLPMSEQYDSFILNKINN